jgi:membrane-bound lytic murein transglycosylase MltF
MNWAWHPARSIVGSPYGISREVAALRPRTALLALLAAMSALSGCGDRNDAPGRDGGETSWLNRGTAEDGDGALAGDPLIELARSPWKGDLGGMIERRMVRVLVVPSRTQYWLELGRHSGIEYEFTAAFERWLMSRQGRQDKKRRLRFVYVPTTVDHLIPDLLAGRGDIAAAMLTVTPERRQDVDFSAPYAQGVREVVVTGPGSTHFESLDELSGRDVFVRRSSSYWTHLAALNETFAKSKRSPVRLVPVPEELSDDEILEMLNAGLIGTTVVDSYEARIWSKVFQNLVVHDAVPLNEGGELAWMIRKNSPELARILAEFMAEHRHGTSFGNTVERKYVGSLAFVKRATSEKELAKLRAVHDLFRKYGEQYSLDWVLLAAQGYQESRLDQRARSRAGAVGIMQLMPATARPLGVGDISQVEPNIHAAAKYSRQLRDRYFEGDAVDELNKGLFTVAAYNAGPTRIQQLRALTARRGLDPNVWFGNVEVLAAERIGAETVGYVANIFKYYVGFKLGFRKSEVGEEIKDALRQQVGRVRHRDPVRTAPLAVSTVKVRPGASTLM